MYLYDAEDISFKQMCFTGDLVVCLQRLGGTMQLLFPFMLFIMIFIHF